jgi:hypothetical protein
MSNKAFSDWADAVGEAIHNSKRPLELDALAPELEFFNLWCESRFGQGGITISCEGGEMRFLSCLDPSDFFAEMKTDKELVDLLTSQHEFIRAAARNAFLKRRTR